MKTNTNRWITTTLLMFFFLVVETWCENLHIMKLSGNNWEVRNVNNSIRLPATVPGGIYSDLITSNFIKDDLFHSFNDDKYRWISTVDWIYDIQFNVGDDLLKKQNQILTFYGVDTISQIHLNGKYIGMTDNMFVEFSFDVKPYLKTVNTLQIQLFSPTEQARLIVQSLPHSSPPDCTPSSYNGECHVNVLRKMQASFAWDWGPAFPSLGIWKDVVISFYDSIELKYVTTVLIEEKDDWRILVKTFLRSDIDVRNDNDTSKISVVGVLNIGHKLISSDGKIEFERDDIENELILIKTQLRVKKDSVKLWWPNGYGDQPLYNLKVKVTYKDSVMSKELKIGFRTIKIIQNPVPNNKGLTFYFSVNGVPVFAKGSNYIPANILPERSHDKITLHHLIYSSYLANMNMLRVWGGGLYESETFYELCDQYGIMIWQDMMFACATYPVTHDFLSSVTLEVNQQIRRLQHHPCIAVWAGNNENEVALRQNWYSTEKNESMFFEEYRILYVDVIGKLISKLDPSRDYLSSSPSNGDRSKAENYIAKNPYDPLYGDTHTYNYFVNSWNPKSYPVPRFCSEYGFQSLPSYSSLLAVSEQDDLRNLSTPFMSHRQHLPAGNVYLILLIERQMSLPCADGCLDTLIYYSQIVQAWSIKTETEVYRRHRSILHEDGTGLTMGALYWQLNDVWQAPSWSSIEFNGKWKMLHYYSKKFFAPILVSPELVDETSINITLASDLLTDLQNVNLHVMSYQWNSTTPVVTKTKPLTVKKECSDIVWSIPISDLTENEVSTEKYIIRTKLTDGENKSITDDNFLFLASLWSSNEFIKPAHVKVASIKEIKKGQFEINLTTEVVALFVWLEIIDVSKGEDINIRFSDNGFHMVEPNYSIICYHSSTTSEKLEKQIRIQVLNDEKQKSYFYS